LEDSHSQQSKKMNSRVKKLEDLLELINLKLFFPGITSSPEVAIMKRSSLSAARCVIAVKFLFAAISLKDS